MILTVLRKLPLIWNAAADGAMLGKPFDSVCMFSVEFKCLAIRSIFRSNIFTNLIFKFDLESHTHICWHTHESHIRLDAHVTPFLQNKVDFHSLNSWIESSVVWQFNQLFTNRRYHIFITWQFYLICLSTTPHTTGTATRKRRAYLIFFRWDVRSPFLFDFLFEIISLFYDRFSPEVKTDDIFSITCSPRDVAASGHRDARTLTGVSRARAMP